MASKSKKRRRVFRASCILAALIIAGSSFAWFTSKDEVTNRLSANADYGVKIVESFAPPANWLPGETVNKDVYATNTGSIAAFVKEEISTVMSATIEKNTPTRTDNSVTLSEEERYAVEAGSFLAYKPNGSSKILGNVVVARPADASDGTKTDFTPDIEGLYVFRRVVNVDTKTKAENFEIDGSYYATDVETGKKVGYDGYYFVPDANGGKYYKISNLSILQDYDQIESDGSTTPTYSYTDYADDGINNDGNLLYASAGFVEEQKQVFDPMDLTCVTYGDDAAAKTAGASQGAGKYLVASYDIGNSNNSTKFEVVADLYDKALHELQYATALQDAALKEKDAADSASTGAGGTDELYNTAKQTLSDAEAALKSAKQRFDNAVIRYANADAAKKEADRNYYTSEEKLYGKEGNGYGTASNPKDGSLKKILDDADSNLTNNFAAYNDFDAFVTELNNYIGSVGYAAPVTGDPTAAISPADMDALKNANYSADFYKGFKTWLAKQAAGEKHGYYTALAEKLIAEYNYNTELAKHGESNSQGYWGAKATADQEFNAASDELGVTPDPDHKDENNDPAPIAGSGARKELYDAQKAYETAVSEYETAYNNKVKADAKKNEKQAQYDEADAMFKRATNVFNAAKIAYEEYVDLSTNKLKNNVLPSDGKLDIFIKLSDKVTDVAPTTNDQWLHHPHDSSNDVAEFYYTGILEGGETTSKLVDSVALSTKVTQDMYKSFDFDINVAMKSVQVIYDQATSEYKADATPEQLGAFAQLATPTDIETVVNWGDTVAVSPSPTDAVNTQYTAFATDKNGDAIVGGVTIKKIADAAETGNYKYSYTDGGTTYYANALTNGTKFVKGTYDSGTSAFSTDENEYITLTSDAVKG